MLPYLGKKQILWVGTGEWSSWQQETGQDSERRESGLTTSTMPSKPTSQVFA